MPATRQQIRIIAKNNLLDTSSTLMDEDGGCYVGNSYVSFRDDIREASYNLYIVYSHENSPATLSRYMLGRRVESLNKASSSPPFLSVSDASE